MLIDADMIVTRPLTPLIERAADGTRRRVRDRQQRFCRRTGASCSTSARPSPAPTSPPGSSFFGGASGAEVLGCSTSASAGSTSSSPSGAATSASYPFLLRRPGRAQRDPRHPRRPERVEALDQRLAADAAVSRPADRRRAHAALRLPRRDRALRAPPVRAQAVARADLPRRLLPAPAAAAGCRRRRRDPAPGGDVAAADANGRRARRLERARVNAVDFLRWHLRRSRCRGRSRSRVEDLRRRRAARAP